MSVQISAYPVSSLMLVLSRVEQVVARAITRLNDPARQGGYFCLATQDPGAVLCIARIGAPSAEKAIEYYDFAQEKACRLAVNPTHVSSWQSRDAGLDRFGGAIRAGKYIFSFSGLPEREDERVMLFAALELELITPDNARAIVEASGDPSDFFDVMMGRRL